LNGRPIVNRSLQYGFEDGYQSLVTIGRHPVGVVLVETHPRFADVNIHPAKRDVRFRDERVARDAVRDVVRATLETVRSAEIVRPLIEQPATIASESSWQRPSVDPPARPLPANGERETPIEPRVAPEPRRTMEPAFQLKSEEPPSTTKQGEFSMTLVGDSAPQAVYRAVGSLRAEPLQLFETYLLVPEEDRLLIIDQHALHERLNFDNLLADLQDAEYQAQQLAVPLLIEVPPAQARLVETNVELFSKLGIELEPFGGNTFQITAICHLYEESKVADAIYRILDELGQGNLFDREDFLSDFLRLATEACRASVKAGDRLSAEEKQSLLDGFRRMRPPYTCPHGRPIITELTLTQMEKSFRRRQ
jgi:DNA mismatch repair protein MutL